MATSVGEKQNKTNNTELKTIVELLALPSYSYPPKDIWYDPYKQTKSQD